MQKSRSKTANGSLGAVCVLVVVCLGFTATGFGQDAASSNKTASAQKTSSTAAAKTKKPASTSSASAKAHPKTTSSTTHQHSASSKTSASLHNSNSKHPSSRIKKTTARGQQKIDPERAQAIQEALIREHYMSGDPTGQWNADCEAAMRRYQADHGWQSKTVPDSRALISLGLGPSHDHLLNPESAMTTGPFPPRAASLTPASNSADPDPRVETNSPSATSPAQASTQEHNAPNHQ